MADSGQRPFEPARNITHGIVGRSRGTIQADRNTGHTTLLKKFRQFGCDLHAVSLKPSTQVMFFLDLQQPGKFGMNGRLATGPFHRIEAERNGLFDCG